MIQYGNNSYEYICSESAYLFMCAYVFYRKNFKIKWQLGLVKELSDGAGG
jgi:hypothetical protein